MKIKTKWKNWPTIHKTYSNKAHNRFQPPLWSRRIAGFLSNLKYYIWVFFPDILIYIILVWYRDLDSEHMWVYTLHLPKTSWRNFLFLSSKRHIGIKEVLTIWFVCPCTHQINFSLIIDCVTALYNYKIQFDV